MKTSKPTQTPNIKIGHGAYKNENALKFVSGKTSAVADLMKRGLKRAEARTVINSAILSEGGYKTFNERGLLIEIEHIKDDRYSEVFADLKK